MPEVTTKSCGYQGYEFGGGYLDSVCVDGRLYDADACDDQGNLYEMDEDIPCPVCNKAGAIKYWADRNYTSGKLTRAKAKELAVSLVTDIRRNRGLEEAKPCP